MTIKFNTIRNLTSINSKFQGDVLPPTLTSGVEADLEKTLNTGETITLRCQSSLGKIGLKCNCQVDRRMGHGCVSGSDCPILLPLCLRMCH